MWSPGLEICSEDPGGWGRGGTRAVCGCVVPFCEGFARHNLAMNSLPLTSAKWVQDEVFMALRNLWCSCSN